MARSSKKTAPNRALRRLLTESGWTEDLLARTVNDLAAEIGHVMRLDRRSVSHWLSGRHPRPPVPELIAEALSRRLGRDITLADIGMKSRIQRQCHGRPDPFAAGDPCSAKAKAAPARSTSVIQGQVAALLSSLAEPPTAGRTGSSGDVYRLAALSVPAWESAVTRRPSHVCSTSASPSATPRVTPEQIAGSEWMIRSFSDLDSAFGGGHSRRALAAYLGHDIGPRLRGAGNAALHRKMLAAATQLTYLCGFMCFDDERHGMAQRYYLAALEMAAEAGNRGAYAITLRALSVQAHALGHRGQALQLAEAATATGASKVPPEQEAFLLGQFAVATAANGDRTRALSALREAESRLSRATTDSPVGGYHAAALEYQQAVVRAELDDLPAAIAALTRSVHRRPATERRSRTITLARLGELHLRRGHLEEAVATWHGFLDDYPHLWSGRAATALTMMRSRLRPFSKNPGVARLMNRAATVRPPAN